MLDETSSTDTQGHADFMITKERFRWCKSSFSGGQNNACIELGAEWRTSSYSGGQNNECVELAGTLDAIRDSKNTTGPVLRADVQVFLAAVRRGRLDH